MDSSNVSSNQSCNVFIYTKSSQVLYPVFYTLIFLVSISGNSLVLYVTCQKKQKFNSTSFYLINLALSDALFILALPGRITYYVREFDWPFGDLMCRVTSVVFYTNTYAGIAFMTCISLDRYLAMVHPHRLLRLRKVEAVRAVCILVWLLVFLQTCPLLFRSMLGHTEGKHTCMEYFTFDGSPLIPYLLLVACTISFCIPLVLIVGCYAQINRKLSRAARQNPMTGRTKCNHKANHITLLILFTFVICFSPYHFNIMQFMVRKILGQPSCEELKAFKTSLQVTVSLMNLNCCLDPVIYFFAIKTYKRKVVSLFKGYLSTSAPSSKAAIENSSSNT
ncbi:G-protein coupled receptor 183-like [Scleropages formosus]|uniref:G-protein coupled receptor 183-like n=1 Tax=Scleropages formosus TaxID=113540 RepID=A0A0P7V162_SCLFO|nr:G-protein coupled receptor 183-like [Scleropages formosus]KPP74716.1 G-protein coupled receptor 183-like [Scleropages formosus]